MDCSEKAKFIDGQRSKVKVDTLEDEHFFIILFDRKRKALPTEALASKGIDSFKPREVIGRPYIRARPA